MGTDKSAMLSILTRQPGMAAQLEAEKQLHLEKAAAEARMAYEFANLHIPNDIRARAKAWGMESFCEVLWNSAFQAGWRERQWAEAAQPEGEGK